MGNLQRLLVRIKMLGKCVLKHTWLSSALAGGHIAVSVPDRYVAVSLVLFSLKTSEFSECVTIMIHCSTV